MTQYCTFTLARHLFGVPVASVSEVFRTKDITRVPLAPAEVAGLLNLRGRIITAIELRAQLGLPSRPEGVPSVNVVVTCADGSPVSLVVDEIGEVLEPPRDTFEVPPDTLPPAIRPLVDGVCKLDRQLMLLLRTERAVTIGGTA